MNPHPIALAPQRAPQLVRARAALGPAATGSAAVPASSTAASHTGLRSNVLLYSATPLQAPQQATPAPILQQSATRALQPLAVSSSTLLYSASPASGAATGSCLVDDSSYFTASSPSAGPGALLRAAEGEEAASASSPSAARSAPGPVPANSPPAPRLLPLLTQPRLIPPAPAAREPETYGVHDPAVLWMNGRPFRNDKVLGQGGFGQVWQIELLIPCGTELLRTETGHLDIDGAGFAALRLASDVLSPHGVADGPHGPHANAEDARPDGPLFQEPLVTDVGAVEMLSSEIRTASMGPPQDLLSFVLNGGEADGTEATGLGLPVPAAAETTENNTLRSIGANEDRTFNIGDTLILKPSGAFFALKLQKAKNREQLAEFAKEADNMGELKGCPFIVQIMDHAVIESSLTLLILMELGACDLGLFLRKCNPLSVADTCRIWRALVRAVDAAHAQDIIHRDIKPQNFVLVPATPFAERVLATSVKNSFFSSAAQRERFGFQVVDDDNHPQGESRSVAERDRGDVKLFLRDPTTGREEVLRLQIKLSDFGMAQPLEIDTTHLSVKGCPGTILYMAPETLRPTVGTKRISKEVDIWALGVILFQMLHDDRTPFEAYYEGDGRIGVAVATSNKEIHKEAMVFDRMKVWIAERKKVLIAAGKIDAGRPGYPGDEARKVKTLARGRGLIVAWMQTEFLFRMCQFCLPFDASDRVVAEDLVQWIGVAVASGWWKEEVCAADGKPSMDFVEQHIAPRIIGRMITEEALPEVFCRKLGNAVDDAGEAGGQEVEKEVFFRSKVFGIFLLVLIAIAGVGAFLGASAGSAGNQPSPPTEVLAPTQPEESTGPLHNPNPSSTLPFLPPKSASSSPFTASSPKMPLPSIVAPTSASPVASVHSPPPPSWPPQTRAQVDEPAARGFLLRQPQPGVAEDPPRNSPLRRESALEMVRRNGLDLEKIPEKFKADRDVVLAAIHNNAGALRYAAFELRKKKEIVLRALEVHFRSFRRKPVPFTVLKLLQVRMWVWVQRIPRRSVCNPEDWVAHESRPDEEEFEILLEPRDLEGFLGNIDIDLFTAPVRQKLCNELGFGWAEAQARTQGELHYYFG